MLVSIIIANYNREDLIIETLRSIRDQTYSNFECIVVDDHSTDNSCSKVQSFILENDRFFLYSRPHDRPKGANACRNYGFTKSSGSLIKFFDSDDIMLDNCLEVQVESITALGLDFCVGDCINFNSSGLMDKPYKFDRVNYLLSPKNFASYKVAWITNDLMVKRSFAQKLEFAERIKDFASEYQYNIKLLCLTCNGKVLNEILAHRRMHDSNMIGFLYDNQVRYLSYLSENEIVTCNYVYDYATHGLRKYLLTRYLQHSFELCLMSAIPLRLWLAFKLTCRIQGVWKALSFCLGLVTGYYFKKGYKLVEFSRE